MTKDEEAALEACRAYFRHAEAYHLNGDGAQLDHRIRLKEAARQALQQVFKKL